MLWFERNTNTHKHMNILHFTSRVKDILDQITGGGIVQHFGEFQNILGTLTILPVKILKLRGENLGTLVVFEESNWVVKDNNWKIQNIHNTRGLRTVLIPNIFERGVEESSEKALTRVKELIPKCVTPASFLPNWQNQAWTTGRFTQTAERENSQTAEKIDGLIS